MKTDEFAFFNQQLAAMVRDGIPLEAALKRLCADMRRGQLRAELEKLEADLAKGTPLREAVKDRKLPDLYRQMLEVAAQSNDLPGILTLLADHYQRRHLTTVRLKGLLVYPIIVLVGALFLSFFLSAVLSTVFRSSEVLSDSMPLPSALIKVLISIWLPPVFLACVAVVVAASLTVGRIRRALRWRLPVCKEASLAQLGSALALMLKSGVRLDDALALTQQLERGTPAESELGLWRQRLAAGDAKPASIMAGSRVVPPLFAWTVSQAGEDIATGFERAAETYQTRASYRTERLLYLVMPCSVLALGIVIWMEVGPTMATFFASMVQFLNSY